MRALSHLARKRCPAFEALDYRSLLTQVTELPALPAAVTRLLATIDARRSSAADIARIIQSDPALAAKVLRLANSAAYGMGETITSVQRATVILGTITIKGMALSYGLFSSIGGPHHDLLDSHFWAHCVSAGIAGQEIARRGGLTEAHEGFMVGLLHDVGQVLLAYWVPSDYSEAVQEQRHTHMPLSIVEQRRFGCTHGQVGAAFLRTWGFPPNIVHAIEYHHEVWKVGVGQKAGPALAQLADIAACRAGFYGLSSGEALQSFPPGLARMVGCSDDAMDDVVALVGPRLRSHADLLHIEAPPAHSVRLLQMPPEAA